MSNRQVPLWYKTTNIFLYYLRYFVILGPVIIYLLTFLFISDIETRVNFAISVQIFTFYLIAGFAILNGVHGILPVILHRYLIEVDEDYRILSWKDQRYQFILGIIINLTKIVIGLILLMIVINTSQDDLRFLSSQDVSGPEDDLQDILLLVGFLFSFGLFIYLLYRWIISTFSNQIKSIEARMSKAKLISSNNWMKPFLSKRAIFLINSAGLILSLVIAILGIVFAGQLVDILQSLFFSFDEGILINYSEVGVANLILPFLGIGLFLLIVTLVLILLPARIRYQYLLGEVVAQIKRAKINGLNINFLKDEYDEEYDSENSRALWKHLCLHYNPQIMVGNMLRNILLIGLITSIISLLLLVGLVNQFTYLTADSILVNRFVDLNPKVVDYSDIDELRLYLEDLNPDTIDGAYYPTLEIILNDGRTYQFIGYQIWFQTDLVDYEQIFEYIDASEEVVISVTSPTPEQLSEIRDYSTQKELVSTERSRRLGLTDSLSPEEVEKLQQIFNLAEKY